MQSRVHLYLDNLYDGGRVSQERAQIFERHVRETASYAVAHLRRGEPVTITATSGAVHAAHPSEGADSTLRFLALIELEDHATPGIHNIHLAQEAPGTRKAQQSLVVAPVQLSRPASGMSETMAYEERSSEAPPPQFSRLPRRDAGDRT